MEKCGKLITASMLLENSGESEIAAIREVVIRGAKVTAFDSDLDKSLNQLQVLSLSNNNIFTLSSPVFPNLKNLVQLNLNFNENISDLTALCCPNLRELFVSSCSLNNIALTNISFKCPKLETLCMFRNCVEELSPAIKACKRLRHLHNIDLDGNPCARIVSYKHEMVRALGSQLVQLDGEKIFLLDRQLADAFFKRKNKESAESLVSEVPNSKKSHIDDCHSQQHLESSSLHVRPNTAPSRMNVVQTSRSNQILLSSTTSKQKRSGVKLFRSNFLNNNPVILDYLARNVIANPGSNSVGYRLSREDGNEDKSYTEDNDSVHRFHGKGFVDRIRRGTTGMRTDEKELRRLQEEREIEKAEANARAVAATTTMAEASAAAKQNAENDPSEIVRRLLRAIELLQEERSVLVKQHREGKVYLESIVKSDGLHLNTSNAQLEPVDKTTLEDLSTENNRLQMENANMYDTLEQNKQLRIQLEASELKANTLKRKVSTLSTSSLIAENNSLKRTISILQARLDESGIKLSNDKDVVKHTNNQYEISEDDMNSDELEELLLHSAKNIQQLKKEVCDYKESINIKNNEDSSSNSESDSVDRRNDTTIYSPIGFSSTKNNPYLEQIRRKDRF